jgi:hypothetical protein
MARPTSYTVDILAKAEDYIENCPDIIPTVVGLCLHIGIAKSTAYDWAIDENKEFSDILAYVGELQEKKLIVGGLTNEFNSAITKMMLTKHGYTDKTETDITTKGKSINTWTVNPVTTSKD